MQQYHRDLNHDRPIVFSLWVDLRFVVGHDVLDDVVSLLCDGPRDQMVVTEQ